jgi:hypothetical protein
VANQKPSQPDTFPTDPTELREFLKRAQRGDESTLPGLRAFLRSETAVESFRGNLAREAEEAFVSELMGKNLLIREALLRKLELLRAELAGPNPNSLERVLVERVVACWTWSQHADYRYARAGSLTLPQHELYQRRMGRAHQRFLAAAKTLATVRRLALPVLLAQVSLDQRQFHLNASGAAAKGGPTALPPAGDP